ncbi:MAG: methionyl-tRNA formyltransferase [Flavobacteriales bacterium]|nr:methionyl-tRNA formyltransferase [Flavobacteriales bacterium]MCB9168020.1 methionyl-tRNA formyltransferase [Flavobacteriales bacterium]
MELPRIVFMGTPEFAVASLEALYARGIPIAAVITAPDRPAGRGLKLRQSAVKLRAEGLGLPVLQPEKLRSPDLLDALDRTRADLYVVVAFRMLPEVVWCRPPLGTINLHASLLPDYRGAAPINWAIINGEKRTGVTTFELAHAIDTGDLLLQRDVPIGPDETAGELHDRLMSVGADLLVRTVEGIAGGTLEPVPQDDRDIGRLHQAPKLDASTCRIDPSAGAQHVHDLVRGCSPFPSAWAELVDEDGRTSIFKILRTRLVDVSGVPGTVDLRDGRPVMHCGDRSVELLEVRPEGRHQMTGHAFVLGQRRSFRFR